MQKELLNSHEIELSQWSLEHVDEFKGCTPVPISWDSTPGNWLVNSEGSFSGMIDFENMLWGIDVDHFSILFERYFIDNESAMKAFFAGYGAGTLQQKSMQIRICCIKLALGDILWGTQQGAAKVEKYGKSLLRRLYEDTRYISP